MRSLSPNRARRRGSGRTRKPSHALHAEGGCVSSTAGNNRGPCHVSRVAGNLPATVSPSSTRQCRARCPALPNNRSYACGNSGPAAAMARPPWRVKRLACLFDESVEISIAQKRLETVVKHMARRARHLRPGHHEFALDLALTPHRHRRSPSRIFVLRTESDGPGFVNTLLRWISRS